MNKEILNLICCPECNSDLIFNESNLECIGCKNKYIIKDNIFVLIDENLRL